MNTSRSGAQLAVEDAFAELAKRVSVPEPPPDDFDPFSAAPDLLLKFGIPPRPSPESQPLSARFWERLYAPPFTFLPDPFLGTRVAARLGYLRSAPGGGGAETSDNWSGAYIMARDSEMLVEVHGGWRVPEPRGRVDAEPNERFDSSVWIGLDGQRRYFHSSLPQLGTQQTLKWVNGVKTVECRTWMQWWARDTKADIVPLGVSVSPGDEVLCSIVLVDLYSAKLTLRNLATGQVVNTDIRSPAAVPPYGNAPVRIRVSGATAEWITERPTDPFTNIRHRLPDYGTVRFTHCHAVSAVSPAASARHDRDLSGATRISMYERRSTPARTARISVGRCIDRHHAETRFREVP